ncbi:hypothetical protein ACFQHW_06670 [Lapidilactobacillus achengensis]|uniref:Transposase n=1 Tax=Lapidilactobacillus achengensis TaxID=2486000 RepID=A0ABW1UNL7_9LACO|nr:hypothetical protein [Lapidilactobacillus achengensis]
MPTGVSAQTAIKTLSGWSGEIRGEIAVKWVRAWNQRVAFEHD